MTNLYAYKEGSKSAKAISQALGIKRIKHKGSRFRGDENKTVINWGASELPEEVMKCRVLNKPEVVAACADKKMFFQCMDDSGMADKLVPYTTDKAKALAWIKEGGVVVCRTLTRANSGRGIVIAEKEEELVNAPLYTKYMPKKHEFRLHFFNGEFGVEMFDVQRKARKKDVPDDQVNWKVRNHNNGFIFARNEEFGVPNEVDKVAFEVFETTTLDFGAVDVIYNEREDRAYVLEINTACGVEGTTLDNYVEMFGAMI